MTTTSRPASGPSRRAVLAGAGAIVAGGAAAAVLSGCDADESEVQVPPIRVTRYPSSGGDWTIWRLLYETDDASTPPPIYSEAVQAARHEVLRAKKAEQRWTTSDPLLVVDPYGTTCSGLYVYAEDGGELSFTCSVASTPDFSGRVANHAPSGFEGLLIALVPGAHNTLALTWRHDDGTETSGVISIKAPATLSGYGSTIAADVPDAAALSPGLFALTGVSGASDNTFLIDNAGVLRGEFATDDSPQHRFLPIDQRLVLTTGVDQISVIDPLGHASTLIDLGDHRVHHDIVVVGDIAWALASLADADTVEDRVIRVDLDSGDVIEVVDLGTLLPAYERLAHRREGAPRKDWLHVNTIDVVDGVMYLSARETSTIIALDDALEPAGAPRVRWMIGVRELWEGTGYEGLFLDPVGDPIGIAGQHTVLRIDDEALPTGHYYLEMFNNNYWYLGTRDPEVWEPAAPPDAATNDFTGVSQVLRYLVDEQSGSFRQDTAIEVPFSSVVSGVQRLGGGGIDAPFVANSGKANQFSERTADGTVLASYRYDSDNFGYRVYKDPFEGFWFRW